MVDAVTHTVVMDGLDAVAIGIQEEAPVVILEVLATRTRLAVAPVPGVRPPLPELVDQFP